METTGFVFVFVEIVKPGKFSCYMRNGMQKFIWFYFLTFGLAERKISQKG